VADTVFDRYRIRTYKEAGWKPYIIASMILNRKFENPAAILERLLKNGVERKMK
jgi:hypothetical protein